MADDGGADALAATAERADSGSGAQKSTRATLRDRLSPEAWKAFGWSFIGLLAGGIGLECLIKIYEIWAETFEKTRESRLALTAILTIVGGILLMLFWTVFVAAIRHGSMIITSSQADIEDALSREPYPALITALSTCAPASQGLAIEAARKMSHLPPKERLAAFCSDPDLKGVSWQQTIRGINHHVRWNDEEPVGFPDVCILLSGGENGSAKQWQDFRRLLEQLYRGLPNALMHIEKVELSKQGLDFEVHDQVVRVLEAQLLAFGRRGRRGEVMIDATGGQKPFSIAAAIVTLRSPEQRFQYVTNAGKVTYYNAKASGQLLPSSDA